MPHITSFQLEHVSACPRIRLLNPLESLVKQQGWSLDLAVSNFDWPTHGCDLTFQPERTDVAVFQRRFAIKQELEIFQSIKRHHIPMVFDIDDDFLNIAPDHIHYQKIRSLRPFLLELLSLSDLVTVTTEELVDLYSPHCRRVEIIRNTIDPLMWSESKRWTRQGPLVILYSGTNTHTKDLAMVESALIQLLNEYKGDVRLHLWGCSTETLESHPYAQVVAPMIFEYQSYASHSQMMLADIGIAPLVDEHFNRCKSAIKWKEFAAGSIPVVCSRIPAYERVCNQGESGLVCDGDPQQWYQALKSLIDNKVYRQQMGEACYQKVMAEYTVSHAQRRWEELLNDVMVKKPALKKPVTARSPYVSIIIPTYNRWELTIACLEAVFANTHDLDFEVLVVDNASEDQTLDEIRKRGFDARIIALEKNHGFAQANNIAVNYAIGDCYVMLNNDTQVQPGWLDALLKCQKECQADLVGARLHYPDGRIQHAGVALFPDDDKPHALYGGLSPEHPKFEDLVGCRRPFQAVTAACWLVKRAVWKALKGFDEAYLNGYEDVDFCLRLQEAGV